MRTLRIDEDIVIAGGYKYQELDRFIARLRWVDAKLGYGMQRAKAKAGVTVSLE